MDEEWPEADVERQGVQIPAYLIDELRVRLRIADDEELLEAALHSAVAMEDLRAGIGSLEVDTERAEAIKTALDWCSLPPVMRFFAARPMFSQTPSAA